MMNPMKENVIFIRALAELPKPQVRALLQHASKTQLRSLSELAVNILASVLQISKKYISELRIHKRFIRKLADESIRTSERKQVALTNVSATIALARVGLNKLDKIL